MADTVEHVDVLIVGAGLSGIGAAYRLQEQCPDTTYAILEGRAASGGTWDLFRYPGIRSDSDMYTLGYPFRPWTGKKAIADGADILAYIRDTAEEFGIDRHIRYRHKVVAASWSSEEARWRVDVVVGDDEEPTRLTTSFLFMCSGYYSYDRGHTPAFPGIEDFGGQVVHPQEWPEDLDYAGKRIVVIGSGATAVTLIPNLAKTAAHVTMLQRSPTYIGSLPAVDPLAVATRKLLPPKAAHQVNRWRSVLFNTAFYQFCQRRPALAKKVMKQRVKAELPDDVPVDPHFDPRYDPWDQRVCLVPDGDLFRAMRKGTASVVTDHIDTFTETGIRLASGEELEADIVVTATGLTLVAAGGITFDVDGRPVVPGETFVYKGFMLSGVPNAAMCVGYTNASWTLRSDITARSVARLWDLMQKRGHTMAVAEIDDESMAAQPLLGLTSGYVQRAAGLMPKQGNRAPWLLRQNFILDLATFKLGDLTEAIRFSSPDKRIRRQRAELDRDLDQLVDA
ncbi:MAG TPA: NAD(P)/FAD-dependent oxidoreductase [Iamia sp.]|nr:NAD(P)/FAD-dependent oxidoreductase [Iamia sp.]